MDYNALKMFLLPLSASVGVHSKKKRQKRAHTKMESNYLFKKTVTRFKDEGLTVFSLITSRSGVWVLMHFMIFI